MVTDDNSRTVMATVISAVLGAIVGYLFLTDRGRRRRQQIDHTLDDVARELDRARRALCEGIATAEEGGTRLGKPQSEQTSSPQELGASTAGTSRRRARSCSAGKGHRDGSRQVI